MNTGNRKIIFPSDDAVLNTGMGITLGLELLLGAIGPEPRVFPLAGFKPMQSLGNIIIGFSVFNSV